MCRYVCFRRVSSTSPNMQVTLRPLRCEPNIPPDGSCDWLLLSWSCRGQEVMDHRWMISVAGLTRVLNNLEESSLSSSCSFDQGDVALIRLSALRSSLAAPGQHISSPRWRVNVPRRRVQQSGSHSGENGHLILLLRSGGGDTR